MSESLTLRAVNAADLPTIVAWPQDAVELRNLFPRASWPHDHAALVAHLAHHPDSVVLVDDRDQPVAFASFYSMQHQGRVWIGHFIVHPAWRRQGVGERLLHEMQQLALKQFSAVELAAICFVDNISARVFYQRQGFIAEGWELRTDHRDEQVRALRLVLPLSTQAATCSAAVIQAK